jgi:hypothetical protein
MNGGCQSRCENSEEVKNLCLSQKTNPNTSLGQYINQSVCIWVKLTSLHFTSLHSIPLHFISLHSISLHSISLQFISLRFTSLHSTPIHFTSLHSVSLHFSSFHFTPFHFTSLHLTLVDPLLPIGCRRHVNPTVFNNQDHITKIRSEIDVKYLRFKQPTCLWYSVSSRSTMFQKCGFQSQESNPVSSRYGLNLKVPLLLSTAVRINSNPTDMSRNKLI